MVSFEFFNLIFVCLFVESAFSTKRQFTEEEFATRYPMPQLDPEQHLYENISVCQWN